MLVRNCPIKGAGGCEPAKDTDIHYRPFQYRFYGVLSSKKYSSILNSLPVYLGDKTRNTDFTVLYFTLETKKNARMFGIAIKSNERMTALIQEVYTTERCCKLHLT